MLLKDLPIRKWISVVLKKQSSSWIIRIFFWKSNHIQVIFFPPAHRNPPQKNQLKAVGGVMVTLVAGHGCNSRWTWRPHVPCMFSNEVHFLSQFFSFPKVSCPQQCFQYFFLEVSFWKYAKFYNPFPPRQRVRNHAPCPPIDGHLFLQQFPIVLSEGSCGLKIFALFCVLIWSTPTPSFTTIRSNSCKAGKFSWPLCTVKSSITPRKFPPPFSLMQIFPKSTCASRRKMQLCSLQPVFFLDFFRYSPLDKLVY